MSSKPRCPVSSFLPEDVERSNMSQEAWLSLQAAVAQEFQAYRNTGGATLASPNRSHTTTHLVGLPEAPSPASKSRIPTSLPYIIGQLDDMKVDPNAFPGLNLLRRACECERRIVIAWTVETELQRRIRERQTALDQFYRERTTRAIELTRDQQKLFESPPRTVDTVLDFKADHQSDEASLSRLEQRIAAEAREEEARKKAAEAERQRVKEVLQKKKADRQAKFQSKQYDLRQLEEKTMDEFSAVLAVRQKFEEGKKKFSTTSDVRHIE